jgi:hypothetical protein
MTLLVLRAAAALRYLGELLLPARAHCRVGVILVDVAEAMRCARVVKALILVAAAEVASSGSCHFPRTAATAGS